MSKHSNPQNKGRGKGKSHIAQLQIIFRYLQKHIATASMVSVATGVPQKNFTRYKRRLEKAGQLWEIKKALCKETGYKAWYLTTNPDNAPKGSKQLKLF